MKGKIRLSVLTILIIVSLLPLSTVLASPSTQEPTPPPPTTTEPIVGTIVSIVIQGDPATETATVEVTLTLPDGTTQTVELSLESALSLGLVITNPDGTVVADDTLIGTPFSLDPSLVLVTVDNKVANALANFFATLFNTDAATIMAYHEDGLGFGEIAQAGFMAYALGGDGTTMDAILLAKQTGDYSTLTLPDGTVVSNWGQLRKAVLTNDKSLQNLGAIMSGRAEKSTGGTNTDQHGKEKPPKDNPHKK